MLVMRQLMPKKEHP
ncbi:hypothetical protein CUMW_265360 [Citrus unshiu]|uniref:Uncharacterized protein n=1 Tax=Citrus unshiu TaxID=55188 RepID=A0A2H5QVI5_CITUN|nr:hypothetical protein CUMW_265360 [Citrus unshiu]